MSNFLGRDLEQAQRALRKQRIVSNQLRYSLIERTIESGVLQYCQANQITVIAFSPFATTYSAIGEHDPEGVLKQISAKSGKTEAQLALNWLIEKEGVLAVPKASTVDHVIEDWGASGWHLPEPDYKLLTDKMRYRRRGRLELTARRLGRHLFQLCGHGL